MLHLGSVYLVVKDFEASLAFYEKLLEMPVSARNKDRFAQFISPEGWNISLMNAYYDINNPDKVVREGSYDTVCDDLPAIAEATNTHKFVFNFWIEDLAKELGRIRDLGITSTITGIKYINAGQPYYYFQLLDPDGNVIEITGSYTPHDGVS